MTTPAARFLLYTDTELRYSCNYSYSELLRDDLTPQEKRILSSLSINESKIIDFPGGGRIKYKRIK